jgi:hypothetical protein
MMLVTVSALKRYTMRAVDGKIGIVSDMLFDDSIWLVRWLVADAVEWLTGHKVLIHPSAIDGRDDRRHELSVNLTKAEVRASPSILQDRPVSQQMEFDLCNHHGLDRGRGGNTAGAGVLTQAFRSLSDLGRTAALDAADAGQVGKGDPHLRSFGAVRCSQIRAEDGAIGHVEDFLVDDVTWAVHYFIVDTRDWWLGKRVLISPHAVRNISWPDRLIHLSVNVDQVRSSPPWRPADVVDKAYQERLHDHYTWPGYGW